MHLKAMSTLSPSHEFKQSIGLTKLIYGGTLLALIGILKELSSVTKVITSSKSAKLGAENAINIVKLIPGAMSPVASLGYFTFLTVKLVDYGGMNFILFDTEAMLVTFKGIS